MSWVVLDDHLLRDVLEGNPGLSVRQLLRRQRVATTNLYLYRLSRSVVAARGGKLTGAWTAERRRALGAELIELPDRIEVLPIRSLAFAMAEIAHDHGVSTLGAEALASAIALDARLAVWDGDDGPRIRAAARVLGVRYVTVAH